MRLPIFEIPSSTPSRSIMRLDSELEEKRVVNDWSITASTRSYSRLASAAT